MTVLTFHTISTFILAYGLLFAIDLRMVILDYGPLFVVDSPFKHTFEVIDIHERKDSDVDYKHIVQTDNRVLKVDSPRDKHCLEINLAEVTFDPGADLGF